MTVKLNSIIEAAAGALGLGDTGDLWDSAGWTAHRGEMADYYDWYDGKEWERTVKKRDPDTGELMLLYPLQINPVQKFCRVHRACLFGMLKEESELPVRPCVRDIPDLEHSKALEGFLGRVWYDSHGASLQFEAGLLTQVYGGLAFKVSWEPHNPRLRYRIAVRPTRAAHGSFFPLAYNSHDPWSLYRGAIGYKISREEAYERFRVRVKEDNATYVEAWTRESYRTTVDGKSVSLAGPDGKEIALEGENPWGAVPIVYIPHLRDGGYFGRSHIPALKGLSKELNARVADKGDAVQAASLQILWVSNTRRQGAFAIRNINFDGQAVAQVIDLGDAPTLPGAQSPAIGSVESRGLPESVADFPGELWMELMRAADVAPVATGDDDVSGGRITGPVTAYRMYPTLQHVIAERVDFSTGLNEISRLIATIAVNKIEGGAYKELGIDPPPVSRDDLEQAVFAQRWRPMIPIELGQRITQLNTQMERKGISLQRYVDELGVQYASEEIERIWEDEEHRALLEAMSKGRASDEAPPQEK